MFHKIKSVSPLPDYFLSVQFAEGCTKIYDVKPLFDSIPVFLELKDTRLFSDVYVDVSAFPRESVEIRGKEEERKCSG